MYLYFYITGEYLFEALEHIREYVREIREKTTSVIMQKYNRLHPTGITWQKATSVRRSRDRPMTRNNLNSN